MAFDHFLPNFETFNVLPFYLFAKKNNVRIPPRGVCLLTARLQKPLCLINVVARRWKMEERRERLLSPVVALIRGKGNELSMAE